MESDNLNKDCIIHKEYLLKNELVIKGYRVLVKHLRLRSDIIIIVAFALVIILNVVSLMRHPASYMTYVTIVVCFITITIIWLMPRILLKKIAKAFNKAQEETYIFDWGEDRITFSTEASKETVINFKDENITVIKTKDLYEIITEISFYVIPLNIFTAQEVQQLDGMFSNALGKKFCRKKHK